MDAVDDALAAARVAANRFLAKKSSSAIESVTFFVARGNLAKILSSSMPFIS